MRRGQYLQCQRPFAVLWPPVCILLSGSQSPGSDIQVRPRSFLKAQAGFRPVRESSKVGSLLHLRHRERHGLVRYVRTDCVRTDCVRTVLYLLPTHRHASCSQRYHIRHGFRRISADVRVSNVGRPNPPILNLDVHRASVSSVSVSQGKILRAVTSKGN
jgi:hypothetical protein